MYHHLLEQAMLDHPLGAGSATYRKFIDATVALLRNDPTHPDLIAVIEERQSGGEENASIPVNLVNVVLESRCDRKGLIGKNPRYPKLSAFIRGIKSTHGVNQTTTALIDRLQAETREWKQRERVLRSRLAEKALELADTRRDLVDAREKAARAVASMH
ncbi:hypothetical protein [Sphingomonas sp. NIC1]|uniref:hypothetical protein n=1 Tax=Sphingomonas sp. NIC1 TaxID=1961362 RepID=UPI0007C0DB9E|nr:hypothetical protein [Sphingomonas sp. NIC1]ANC86674.1 hypothetical protein A7E77_07070 [Sphingomonas sp. NIC1]